MALQFRPRTTAIFVGVVTETKELGNGVMRAMLQFDNGKYGDKKEEQYIIADFDASDDVSQYTRTLIDTVKRGCVLSFSGAATYSKAKSGHNLIVVQNPRIISIVAMPNNPSEQPPFEPKQPTVVMPAVRVTNKRVTQKDGKVYHSFSFMVSETVDTEDIQSNGYPAQVESLWGKFLITTRPTTPESVLHRIESLDKGSVISLVGTACMDVNVGNDGRTFINLQVSPNAWEVVQGSSSSDGASEYSEAEDIIGF